MKTDIERLHSVVERKTCGRGCGKTFARVHELASNIDLDLVRRGVIVITAYRDISYILPMIRAVFEERELPPIKQVGPYKFQCGDTILDFVAECDYVRYSRGRDNFFEIPMRHWD